MRTTPPHSPRFPTHRLQQPDTPRPVLPRKASKSPASGAAKKARTVEGNKPAHIHVPTDLLEGRGAGAFLSIDDAMTATPEQHVHNFFAARGEIGGAFLGHGNPKPYMAIDARMLRALDLQTKAMEQYHQYSASPTPR